jgi:hypothetical protein
MIPGKRTLLIVMAVLEAAIGLALIVAPSVATMLLLGSSLDTPLGLLMARLAGVALISLGAMCWFVSDSENGKVLSGAISSMFVYNIGAGAILAYAGVGLKMSGFGLWPTLLLHVALAAVCVSSVVRKSAG